MTRARQIVSSQEGSHVDFEDSYEDGEQVVCRVQVRQSPYVDTFYQYHIIRITIDSVATGNMIRASLTKAMYLKRHNQAKINKQSVFLFLFLIWPYDVNMSKDKNCNFF